jgi:hypothetical protein
MPYLKEKDIVLVFVDDEQFRVVTVGKFCKEYNIAFLGIEMTAKKNKKFAEPSGPEMERIIAENREITGE